MSSNEEIRKQFNEMIKTMEPVEVLKILRRKYPDKYLTFYRYKRGQITGLSIRDKNKSSTSAKPILPNQKEETIIEPPQKLIPVQQEQLQNLQNENQMLMRNVMINNQELLNKQNEITNVNIRNRMLNEANKDLRHQLKEQSEQSDILQKSLEQTKEKKKLYKQSNLNKEQTINKLETSLNQNKITIDDLYKQVDNYKTNAAKKDQEHKLTKQDLEQKELIIEQLNNKIQNLNDKISANQNNDNKVRHLTEQLNKLKQDLDFKTREIGQIKAESEAKNEEQKQRAKKIEDLLHEKRSLIEKYNKEIEELKKNKNEGNINELQEKIATLTKELESTKTNLETIRNDALQRQKGINFYKEKSEKLTKQLNELQQIKDKPSIDPKMKEQLEQQIMALQNQIVQNQQAYDIILRNAKNQIAVKDGLTRKQQQDIQILTQNINEYQKIINNLQSQIKPKKSKWNDASFKPSDISKLYESMEGTNIVEKTPQWANLFNNLIKLSQNKNDPNYKQAIILAPTEIYKFLKDNYIPDIAEIYALACNIPNTNLLSNLRLIIKILKSPVSTTPQFKQRVDRLISFLPRSKLNPSNPKDVEIGMRAIQEIDSFLRDKNYGIIRNIDGNKRKIKKYWNRLVLDSI